MTRNLKFLLVAAAVVFVAAGTLVLRQAFPSAQAQPVPASGSFDAAINENAQRMLDEGRASSGSTPLARRISGAASCDCTRPLSARSWAGWDRV